MTRRKKSARLAPYHFTGKKKKRKKERKKERKKKKIFQAKFSLLIHQQQQTKTNKKTNLMDLPDADDSRLRKTRSICSIEMRKKKRRKKKTSVLIRMNEHFLISFF